MPKGIHITHDIPKYIEAYQRNNRLLAPTAAELGIHLETLRQAFKKNNVLYDTMIVHSVDHCFFDRMTPTAMYWAGFIAADGNVESGKPRVKVELSTKDKSHLEKFKRDLVIEAPIVDTIRRKENGTQYNSQIRFTSAQIAQALLSHFNITPAKSKTYTFPSQIADHLLLSHFIRGLVDGDGWIYDRQLDGKLDIGLCGTPMLIEPIIAILDAHLQFVGSHTYCIRKDGLAIFKITNAHDAQSLIRYLYQDCEDRYLDRKYQRAQNILMEKPHFVVIPIETMHEAYQRLGTFEAVGKELDCDPRIVRSRMLAAGLYQKRRFQKICFPAEVLLEAYQRLGTLARVAQELGCSANVIRKRMNELGLRTGRKTNTFASS
jgi:hypothetical protein